MALFSPTESCVTLCRTTQDPHIATLPLWRTVATSPWGRCRVSLRLSNLLHEVSCFQSSLSPDRVTCLLWGFPGSNGPEKLILCHCLSAAAVQGGRICTSISNLQGLSCLLYVNGLGLTHLTRGQNMALCDKGAVPHFVLLGGGGAEVMQMLINPTSCTVILKLSNVEEVSPEAALESLNVSEG